MKSMEDIKLCWNPSHIKLCWPKQAHKYTHNIHLMEYFPHFLVCIQKGFLFFLTREFYFSRAALIRQDVFRTPAHLCWEEEYFFFFTPHFLSQAQHFSNQYIFNFIRISLRLNIRPGATTTTTKNIQLFINLKRRKI